MKRFLILAVAVAAALLAPQASRADILLTLSSTTPDLTNLVVGQTVHFDVTLSGLGDAGNPSDFAFLGTDVNFSSALFGTPTSLTAGAVIPDPTAASFTPVTGPGLAGEIYDVTFSGSNPITVNGIVFSFDLVALSAGSGTVFINDASAFDSAGNEYSGNPTSPGGIDISSSLRYNINGGVVPEPSSLILVSLGFATTLLYGRRRLRAS